MDKGEKDVIFQNYCDRHCLYELLCVCAGMMGAYTYLIRGHRFCHAQTLNTIMLFTCIASGEVSEGLYYLFPIAASIAGIIAAMYFVPSYENRTGRSCVPVIIAFELVLLIGVGFIPGEAPAQISQVLVGFISAVQYAVFRKADGLGMSTIFVTNHYRQCATWFVEYKRNGDRAALKNIFVHSRMIIAFILGIVSMTLFTNIVSERAVWLTAAPLLIALAFSIRADSFSYRQEQRQYRAGRIPNRA